MFYVNQCSPLHALLSTFMESENFKVYETGTNFICFESKNCDEINEYLLKNDILIRSFPDLNLLRVTVGKENDIEDRKSVV